MSKTTCHICSLPNMPFLMMNTFYKRAWQVLFIIFYPFITLFSLLFIGLVSFISVVSRIFAGRSKEQAAEGQAEADGGWKPFMQHHGFYLSRKPVHEVQFGPILYQFKSNPPQAAIEQAYWSDFIVPIGEGFLLQRWPSIAEHELEQFELVYVRPGMEKPIVLSVMSTFYWQTREISHEQVEIMWNEEERKRVLLVDEEQLP